MSNLNLPTMTYAHLNDVLGDKWRKQIAYATIAERVNSDIYIKHHASVIAVLSPDEVYITNAGYESRTTADRLHRILADNRIPYRVRIKQYRMILERIGDWQGPLEKREDMGAFTRATFRPLAGTSIMYKAA